MGKVIYPDSWHPKKVVSLREERKHREIVVSDYDRLEEVALLDACFYSESKINRTLIEQALICGNGIMLHIGSKLSGFSMSHAQLILRQHAFKTSTLEELCRDVLSSQEYQWQRKPLYYSALFLELTLRSNAVTVRMRERNDPNSS